MTDSDLERPLQIQKRNPDAGPPNHIGHLIGREIVRFYRFLLRPDILFAIKAGIVSVLVSSMAWSKTTAAFWYDNRGIWVVIMCALTLAQFTADTIFGFVIRIIGTFLGALLGMVIWYIGSGSGTGNPYALSAVLAVCLPFIMFIRINFVKSSCILLITRFTSLLCPPLSFVSRLLLLLDTVGTTYFSVPVELILDPFYKSSCPRLRVSGGVSQIPCGISRYHCRPDWLTFAQAGFRTIHDTSDLLSHNY